MDTSELVATRLAQTEIDHWRESLIIMLACCAALGLFAGFILRLPAFIALSLLAIAVYAVFRAGSESGLELTYHILLVGIALQAGYFIAIVTQTLFRFSLQGKQIHTNTEPRRTREQDSHHQG